MADIVSPQTRSRMMAGIKGKNTKPEIVVRKALFARGYRYRLHDKKLPGKPDIIFPRYRAIIFVHGCFWHGHVCHLFKWPSSRKEFWHKKITGNKERDTRQKTLLAKEGWRIMLIYECALKGKSKRPLTEIIDRVENFLNGNDIFMEIAGKP